jgi:hypothetical protein
MPTNVARNYLSVANEQNNVNWVNNGGFVDYPAGLGLYEDTTSNTLSIPAGATGSDIDGLRQFNLLDAKLYQTVNYSFISAPEAGKDNILGYWDIYGASASIEVAPAADDGSVVTSIDGGNLVRISFPAAGTVTFDQEIADLKPFTGESATLAISGRSFAKNVAITLSLVVDDVPMGVKLGQSQTFGRYRRLVSAVKIPVEAKKAVFRVEIVGTKGSSVGLSGAALFLGAIGPVARFTPSLPDLIIPSGTTFLVEGDVCPAGYRETSFSQDSMALLTSGQATLQGGELVYASGQDEHDHNPDGAGDALDTPPSSEIHDSAPVLPLSEQVSIHGIPFGFDPGGTITGGNQFPNAKPAVVLGVEHTHRLSSNMTALPPTFPVRFCTKI